jgi:hypothetical protein
MRELHHEEEGVGRDSEMKPPSLDKIAEGDWIEGTLADSKLFYWALSPEEVKKEYELSLKRTNMIAQEKYEPPITVILTCTGERVKESEVEFADISEDDLGRDVLVFVCPRCQKVHKSLRFG